MEDFYDTASNGAVEFELPERLSLNLEKLYHCQTALRNREGSAKPLRVKTSLDFRRFVIATCVQYQLSRSFIWTGQWSQPTLLASQLGCSQVDLRFITIPFN